MSDRILLVEDEERLRRTMRLGLVAHGFEVLEAGDGESALDVLSAQPVDLVVLDLGLPRLTGLEVLRRLRRFSTVPVIVLSARAERADKVGALDIGADDYVTKPFDAPELLARIRASLRRKGDSASAPVPPVVAHDVAVDLARRLVTRNGVRVRLTRTELALLEELVRNPGKLLSHDHLLRRVWSEDQAVDASNVRSHVKSLRRKLGDDAANPRLILSEIGVGYRWIGGTEP